MSDVDVCRFRWLLCLHESGHAVAAEVRLGVSASARVFGSVGGAANCGIDASIAPTSFSHALIAAAGPAAERLAWSVAPPAWDPPAEIFLEGATQDRDHSVRSTALPDHELMALWSMREYGRPPGDLLSRIPDWQHYRVRLLNLRWSARAFVREHQDRIVAVARRLFEDGTVSLENVK